ncbi:hypothetical protein PENTCL1PPCAC_9208, partial [Pristionchus entomophagus]
HVLSKYDCDRGLMWQYCIKTLTRTPPADRCSTPVLLDWNRTRSWTLLIRSTIISGQPCLSMDDSSLTLDSKLDEDIEKCVERYSRGLVQYIERPEG